MTNPGQMVVWLRKAMDAAQADAEAAAKETGSADWEYQAHGSLDALGPSGFMVAVGSQDYLDPAPGRFMAANDPAAVLRRIAADRKILAAHPYTTRVVNPVDGSHSAGFGCETCHDWDGVPEGRGWCDTVRLLAEGYGWTEAQPAPRWPECMCTPSGECGNCWEKRQQRTDGAT